MTNDTERKRILSKLQALMSKTRENGASEAEVDSAMRIAQKMMQKHEIEMADVMAAGGKTITAEDVVEDTVRVTGQIDKHEARLMQVICLACNVEFYWAHPWDPKAKKGYGGRVNQWIAVGLEMDVAFAKLLFIELIITTQAMARATGIKKQFDRKKYCLGFADGLFSRLWQEKQKHQRAAAANTTALISRRSLAIQTRMEKKQLTERKTKPTSQRNSDAYRQGVEDSEDYELPQQPAGKAVTNETPPNNQTLAVKRLKIIPTHRFVDYRWDVTQQCYWVLQWNGGFLDKTVKAKGFRSEDVAIEKAKAVAEFTELPYKGKGSDL